MFMYLGLFVHSIVVFHVFMFYVGLLIVLLCFMSDIVLFFIDCYRAMLCIRGTSHGPVSVSVTSRSSTKMAKQRITQTTPHDSPGTLVF